MKPRREWTRADEQASMARAAYLFLNMVRCSDCGLPWPEGYVHNGCPTPEPEDAEEAEEVPA